MEGTEPNWVAARANCNIDDVFERLLEYVSYDVHQFNQLPERASRGRKFTCERRDAHTILIAPLVKDGLDRMDTVCLSKSGDNILVFRQSLLQFVVELVWDYEALKGKLRVEDNEDQPLWMVSQQALGDLLFS